MAEKLIVLSHTIIKKLHYICGTTSNCLVTYRNNIYGFFWNKMCTTKPPELIPIFSNKNLNVKIDEVIDGNDISTYDQAHDVAYTIKL